MKTIKVEGRGKIEFLIDDEDYSLISQFKWFATRSGSRERRYIYTWHFGVHIYLTRMLFDIKDRDILIDHINNNPLDNRRENLRKVTRLQNGKNRSKTSYKKMSSIYKGVTFHSRDLVWQAAIVSDGNRHYLGSFQTEIEAAKAYNEASQKLHGEYGKLNIIQENTIELSKETQNEQT